MNTKFFSLIVLTFAFLLCSGAAGQENAVSEPEYIGVIDYLNSSGRLRPLDREVPRSKASLKALGFGGAKLTVELDGAKAALRIPPEQAMSFVVQLPNGVDPRRIQLYSFTVRGNKRELAITTREIRREGRGIVPIKLNISRYGQSSYKMVPFISLSVGEYGFKADDSSDIFCFGVEAKQ